MILFNKYYFYSTNTERAANARAGEIERGANTPLEGGSQRQSKWLDSELQAQAQLSGTWRRPPGA